MASLPRSKLRPPPHPKNAAADAIARPFAPAL
jgi:hypothetical protein